MYDFYEIKYGDLYGCIYCRPWPWEILTSVQGIRIVCGGTMPPPARKQEIEEFFTKKGVKCVVWR